MQAANMIAAVVPKILNPSDDAIFLYGTMGEPVGWFEVVFELAVGEVLVELLVVGNRTLRRTF